MDIPNLGNSGMYSFICVYFTIMVIYNRFITNPTITVFNGFPTAITNATTVPTNILSVVASQTSVFQSTTTVSELTIAQVVQLVQEHLIIQLLHLHPIQQQLQQSQHLFLLSN